MKTLNFISSSNVRRMEYNEETKVLRITFVGGKTYEYEDVDEDTFDKADHAKSVGKYFSDHIRGKFKAKEV